MFRGSISGGSATWKHISHCQWAGWRKGLEKWLNRIESPSQSRDNILFYYKNLHDPNALLLYYTYEIHFRRLLILKKGLHATQYKRTLLWMSTSQMIQWERVVDHGKATATAPCSFTSYFGQEMSYVYNFIACGLRC